jgi:hypothetical protein
VSTGEADPEGAVHLGADVLVLAEGLHGPLRALLGVGARAQEDLVLRGEGPNGEGNHILTIPGLHQATRESTGPGGEGKQGLIVGG